MTHADALDIIRALHTLEVFAGLGLFYLFLLMVLTAAKR